MQRFMLLALFSVLLLGLVRVQGQPADDAKSILGDWVLSEFESDNKKIPAPPEAKAIMRFTADKLEMVGDKKTATYKLGTDKNLATIDIIPDTEKDKGMKGIYELKGDTLRICFMTGPDATTRPREFNSKAPQGIITLKREKK